MPGIIKILVRLVSVPRLVTFYVDLVLDDYSGDHKNPPPTTKEFPYIYTVDRIPRASKTC